MSEKLTPQQPELEPQSHQLIPVCFSGDQLRIFYPVILNNIPHSPESHFISSSIQQISEHIDDLSLRKTIAPAKPKHGRPHSRPEQRRIRANLDSEINSLSSQISALKGYDPHPIMLIKEEGDIVGYEIQEFTPAERAWWNHLLEHPNLFNKVREDPFALCFLQRFFVLRYCVQRGLTREESDQARIDLEEFKIEYRETTDEFAEGLQPYMAEISELFSSSQPSS